MSDQITIVIPEDATMQILDTLLKSTKTVNGSSAYEVLDLIRSWRQDIVATAPAVSEDQPKPRESVTYEQYAEAIRAAAKAQATSRQRHGMAHQPKTFYVGDMVKAAFDAAGIKVASVDFTALSEVLADSEQVRHG